MKVHEFQYKTYDIDHIPAPSSKAPYHIWYPVHTDWMHWMDDPFTWNHVEMVVELLRFVLDVMYIYEFDNWFLDDSNHPTI